MARATFALAIVSLLYLYVGTSFSDLLPIGVNYGTLTNNLPPPLQVATFIKDRTTINRVKLFDTNPDIVTAFANTGIAITITVPNGEIPTLAKPAAAEAWVAQHVKPFYPATKIAQIAIGNEVMHWHDKNQVAHLVPAMWSTHNALQKAGINDIRITTPQSMAILTISEPPSAARFRRVYDQAIFAPMLNFLNQTGSSFMVNPYPWFGYSDPMANYCLFKPNKGIFDPNTKITYTNMFDAQMDAVYSAMSKLGFGNVPISVGETGWPSAGDLGQTGATVQNAADYNGNLIKHVNSGKGTPLMPGRKFETFIFALFNENLKPGPASERNFGLFRPDLTPVYDVGIVRGQNGVPSATPANPAPVNPAPTNPAPVNPAPVNPAPKSPTWCVARTDANDTILQANIDYACSHGVDCKPIQSGGICFLPTTVRSHASFVMNSFYQNNGRNDFDCNFGGSGEITIQNPSYSICEYLKPTT